MNIDRRSFIKYALSATASISIGGWSSLEAAENGMPQRKLGATGENVSLLTLGGHHIGQMNSDKAAVELMRTAIDKGVNFFDNAWNYHGGRSERRMGKALKDGYRDEVFLMTKVISRSPNDEDAILNKPNAKKQLQMSLDRLQVDTIDLWQIHSVGSMSSVKRIYNSGILDYMEEQREKGTIRYIGFTGHDDPQVHREMIERGFDWDTVQLPINPLDYHYKSFTKEVLYPLVGKNDTPSTNSQDDQTSDIPALAKKNDIGVIAMKTLAAGSIPSNNIVTAPDCHRYVMSLPVSTICTGMENMKILEQNLNTFKYKSPMKEQEIEKLLDQTKKAASGGNHEWYK